MASGEFFGVCQANPSLYQCNHRCTDSDILIGAWMHIDGNRPFAEF